MKSITIHKLDPDLAERIEQHARREGLSQNRAVKSILRSALGLKKQARVDYREDFLDLFGTWTSEQSAAFDARIEETRKIETGDWQR
jgi:hypothetical protein